jgi:tRNA A37 threonylcarbamoyladenosine synthetase subunit TsaC/SUA5/YrdC
VIDGGYGETEPSTIVSFENNEFNIIRTGKGNTDLIY